MKTELISAIAAWLAAIIAGFSLFVAKKALDIEKKRERRTELPFNAYLIKGMHFLSENIRDIIFLITITNNSDSDISITSILLNVIYTDSGNNLKKIKLRHDKDIGRKNKLLDYTFADDHPFIPAHKTISSGFIFEIDDRLLEDCFFEKYEIELQDDRGNKELLESIITLEILRTKNEN
jgi:hypothetical protein